jgi:hypothetical protein
MSFTDAHDHEGLKAGVHAAVGTLAALCALYNAVAFCARPRPESHLLRNALFYGLLTIVEIAHVRHHLGWIDDRRVGVRSVTPRS